MNRQLSRIRRYLGIWLWLSRYIAASEPLWLAATTFFGVGARLGTMVGMLATIKCATWILDPSRLPARLTHNSVIPLPEGAILIGLVLIPTFVILAAAGCQIAFSRASLHVTTKVSIRLSLDQLRSRLADTELMNRESESQDQNKISNSFIGNYRKFIKIIPLIVDILIYGFVILIAFTIGALIDWMAMALICIVGVVMAAILISSRHSKMREVVKQKSTAKLHEDSLIIDFKTLSNECDSDGKITKSIPISAKQISDSLSSIYKLDHNFTSDTLLSMNIANSIVIFLLLGFLVTKSGQSHDIASLVSLVILIRFTIQYMQSIVKSLVKAGNSYAYILNFKNGLAPKKPAAN